MMKNGTRVLSVLGLRKHAIVGLDYDDVDFELLRREIKRIQKEFELGTFYIFKTKARHYCAVCFSIVAPEEMIEILSLTSTDMKQQEAFDKLKTIGFRISKKHKRFLPEPFVKFRREASREASLSHARFFAGLYPQFINPNIRGEFNDLTFEEYKLARRENGL